MSDQMTSSTMTTFLDEGFALYVEAHLATIISGDVCTKSFQPLNSETMTPKVKNPVAKNDKIIKVFFFILLR